MKTVHILEGSDVVRPDDWCRPLGLVTMSGGMSDSMSFRSCYTGAPENNVKWVRVRDVLGKPWWNKPEAEINDPNTGLGEFVTYEFMRGDPPSNHILGRDDY